MDAQRKKALVALLLLAPAPSLGAYGALALFPKSALGVSIFVASKLWLFCFPAFWHKYADHGKVGLSRPTKGGFGTAALVGSLMGLIILVGYLTFGHKLVDTSYLRERMCIVGLDSVHVYIGFALYWIVINTVLEEYVWRWFVVKQSHAALQSWAAAYVASALLFTLHHIVAMGSYLDPAPVAICAVAVFVAGWIWSFMYVKYESIWPGCVCHLVVDMVVFGIGAALLFGNAVA